MLGHVKRFKPLVIAAAAFLALIFPAPALAEEVWTGPPEELADRAVEEWLELPLPSVEAIAAFDTVELCRFVPALLTGPPPPEGTRVNLEDRVERTGAAPGVREYTYSASGPGDQLAVVEAVLVETDEGFLVQRVGFRQPPPSGLRKFLQTDAAGWVFTGLTALVLVLLLRRNWLPRLLRRSLQTIRTHRRTWTFTMVLLGGAFVAGTLLGRGLPDECHSAVLDTVSAAVAGVGATEAYESGNVARAAAVTFHQNFVVVSASTLFSLALLFGVPAYLFALFSFFAQAIPFGLISPGGPALAFLAVLLVLELTAYFTVVAGGGMLLLTLVRGGMRALPEAVTKLLLMLPPAALLLLVGAWFEAFMLIRLPPG